MLSPAIVCSQIAASQHGLITFHQACEAGMTARSIERKVGSGLWLKVRPGIYSIAGSRRTWHQDLLGLVLWGGDGALAAGRSAAFLHDLRGARAEELEITSPRRLNDPGDGCILHLQSPYLEFRPELICAIPTGSVEKTIYELANFVGKYRAGIAFDDALRRGKTTLALQSEFIDSIARRGRHNIRRVRELIETRDRRYERVRGDSETTLLPLFDGVQLPEVQVDYDIYEHGRLVATADFAYPNEKFDIEADGHSVHSSEADLQRDKRRDRRLIRLGWTVARFTRKEAMDEKPRVLSDIRAVLIQLKHPFFS